MEHIGAKRGSSTYRSTSLRVATAVIVLAVSGLIRGQEGPPDRRESRPVRETMQGPDHPGIRRGMGYWGMRPGMDRPTSAPGQLMQAGLLEEIGNIPTLDKRVRELLEIQHERARLQMERASIAADTARPSEQILEDFHALLRREDELTTRQQRVTREIAAQADAIRAEIDERQKALEGELVRQPQDPQEEPMVVAERRRAMRTMRFYEVLSSRLDEAVKDPNRTEFLRMMSWRGPMDQGDLDPVVMEQARRQLREIRQQQEKLLRRMEDLEREVGELEDLLGAVEAPPKVAPPGGPPPMPAGPPPR